jgi:hypothetical protein
MTFEQITKILHTYLKKLNVYCIELILLHTV